MRQTQPNLELRELRESPLSLVDSADDVRGREVLDVEGATVGRVDELLVDIREHRVRLLRVELQERAAARERPTRLLPVDAVFRITERQVQINRTKNHIVAAPAQRRGRLGQPYLESVYAHYGLYPYWSPGYVYPTYPAYG